MPIVEDGVKAAVSEMKKASFSRKIRLINYCSCMIVIFVFFNWKYWNLISIVDMPVAPLFSDRIRNINIFILLAIWLLVGIISKFVRSKVIELDKSYKEKEYLIKYCYGEGVIDFSFSVICLTCVLSMFVDYTHKIYPENSFLLWIAIIYITWNFFDEQYILFCNEFRRRLKRG